MSNSNYIVGNLAADPELRFLPSQKAVVSLRIADTPRRLDRATNQWVDGETLWVNAEAWEKVAENIAATFKKGDRVLVVGTWIADSYEDKKTGEKRYAQKLRIEHIGPELRYATAAITRNPRNENGGNGGGYNRGAQQSAPQGGGYSQPTPAAQGSTWGGDDETPF